MRTVLTLLERIGEGAIELTRFAAEEMPVHLAIAALALLAMFVGGLIMVFGT